MISYGRFTRLPYVKIQVYVTGGYRIRPYGILRGFRPTIEITCRFYLRTHAHGQPTVCSANEGQPLQVCWRIPRSNKSIVRVKVYVMNEILRSLCSLKDDRVKYSDIGQPLQESVGVHAVTEIT